VPESWIEKITNGVIRSVTGLVVTSGGYQLFDGHWYGEAIFGAFLNRMAVEMLTAPGGSELYSLVAFHSVPASLQLSTFLSVVLFTLAMMALIAHVIGKPNVAQLAKSVGRPASIAFPPKSKADAKRLALLMKYLYVNYQALVTLAVFMFLVAIFFRWSFSGGLALAFLLIVIPAVLYLLLYPNDLSRGTFLERFAYIGLLGILITTLLGWPQLYGAGVFDPTFPIASGVTNLDHCDEARLQRGPSFVAFENAVGCGAPSEERTPTRQRAR
jgi:hypothetical protein